MKLTKRLIILFLSLVLIGCQTTNAPNFKQYAINETLYNDSAFINYQSMLLETEQDVFNIDQEMRQVVEKQLIPERNIKHRAEKLLRHIFANENIALTYQGTANLTAIESYHSQTANCLSLTIMAYALAKEAKLEVKFQDVQLPEYWVRNGQYSLRTGHVNLVVTQQKSTRKKILYSHDILEIDFNPYTVKKSFPKKIVTKDAVLAMFYNNKGAQAMVEHNYDLAYAYLKKSTQTDPYFSSAWGNLGLLYKINNNVLLAEKTYRYAIDIDKNNLTTLANLAVLLKAKGTLSEVKKIESFLTKKRMLNPYYHALLADEELFNGNYKLALTHYKKAIRLNKEIDEFYFGLAKVYYQLGDSEKAIKAMNKAIKYNKRSELEEKYIAKLNFIRNENL